MIIETDPLAAVVRSGAGGEDENYPRLRMDGKNLKNERKRGFYLTFCGI